MIWKLKPKIAGFCKYDSERNKYIEAIKKPPIGGFFIKLVLRVTCTLRFGLNSDLF